MNTLHLHYLRRYHLAGQNSKHHCAGEDQMLKHTCPTQANSSEMARTIMQDEKRRIPKDLLYGELEKGTRKTGCPLLRFKDIYKGI